jgi:hypothetical protein
MNYNALGQITVGVCFVLMGYSAHKHNPGGRWKVFVFGGAILSVAGTLAMCFGWRF